MITIYYNYAKLGYLVSVVEWLTFSCTISYGQYWKKVFSDTINMPFIAHKVMAKGFKTKTGFVSITGKKKFCLK